MNIKQVSELTGLTKKAIKYYETEGLINVKKNPNNQYREYSDYIVSQLRVIASLRLLRLPIKEIKSLLDGNKSLPDLLNDQLNQINCKLKELHQSKILTETLIQNLSEIEDFSSKIKALESTLQLKDFEKKEYVKEKLLRMFPGKFGELIAIIFEPFLEFKIDDENKQMDWLNLVSYLDDIDEVSIEHPVMQLIFENSNQLVEFKENNRDFIDKIIKKDYELWEQQKNAIINLVKNISENEEFKQNFIEQLKNSKDLPQLKEGSPFSDVLYKISPKYKAFLDNQKQIKKEADKELGFDSQNFLKIIQNNIHRADENC
ncbi:MerR family transcriptional regulator [Bacillus sp. WMMC1349]|uniref:MerR family transcriptional regulator n=1 Tax=Bacillus sp. WMMC1349 TaxID=2736254 RepID=UPI00155485A9|nr:MerR family transcriptional regulator [Bacillus sp. WMMC1349]NPC91362.1 MerR family transcriptional regulator [Bacillus sp. WMMC1349]